MGRLLIATGWHRKERFPTLLDEFRPRLLVHYEDLVACLDASTGLEIWQRKWLFSSKPSAGQPDCASICARMRRILLTIRDRKDFRAKIIFAS
jgi:hypothetical protein